MRTRLAALSFGRGRSRARPAVPGRRAPEAATRARGQPPPATSARSTSPSTRRATSCCYGDVKDKNPFKDIRVRRAVAHALNIDLIVQKVLRGQGTPTGSLVSPPSTATTRTLDKRLPFDPATAHRRCWPRPATPTASASRSIASTSAIARGGVPGRGGDAHAGGHPRAGAQLTDQHLLPTAEHRPTPASSSSAGPRRRIRGPR